MRPATVLRWRGGLLAALLLLSSAGCPGPGPGTGNLNILVIQDAVSALPVPGANVTVLGTALGAMTTASGHAILNGLSAGTHQLKALRIGYCTRTVTIAVVSGTTTAVTIPLCDSGQDHFLTAGNTSGENVVTVFNGELPSLPTPCSGDLTPAGSPGILLPGNAVPASSADPLCLSTAAFFTKSNGAWRIAPAAGIPWTAATGDEIPVSLPPTRVRLPLKLWIATNDPPATISLIGTQLTTLNSVFKENRAGIDVDETTPAIQTMLQAAGSNATEATRLTGVVGSSCAKARAIANEAAIYDPEALNVYYVDHLTAPPSPTERNGWYCYQQGVVNILMVHSGSPEYMLAHEVSHALGLIEPMDGHAYDGDAGLGYDCPADHNLMGYPGLTDGSASAGCVLPADHSALTLGQVFRLSFSTYSWLNFTRPSSATSVRGAWLAGLSASNPAPLACPCEPRTRSTGPCPRALLDVTHPPPPGPSSGPLAACVSSGLDPAMTLNCGDVRTVTIALTDENGVTAPHSLNWDNDNERVATLTPSTTDDLKAAIQAMHAGTAHIAYYAGGRTASQSTTVTVPATGTCQP